MLKKITENKEITTIYIIVLSLLMLGITYAATSTSSIGLSATAALIGVDETAYGDLTFNSSNLDFRPILDTDVEISTDNVVKIDFKVGGASTNTTNDVIYDIALNDLSVSCELLSPYIKWKLLKNGTQISNGSLDYKFDTIVDGRLVLTSTQQDLPTYSSTASGYDEYTFYMWFSDSCQSASISSCAGKADQSDLLGKILNGKIEVELYTGSKKALTRKPSNTLDESNCGIKVEPNTPNLDNGNLIPVYYDNNAEVWKKANSNNKNNSWYDYDSKNWANAVLISDSTKKSTYQNATVGTTITDSDITAFYVWIPRYKYRVWNITRQGGDESTYAYQAYTYGIDIEFEIGTASSGNVECTYNVDTVESASNLSDTCVYNETDTITTESGNTNYTDAWYTHPAFTFGGEEKTGFWIGKFETTGTAESPTVLPDTTSLRNQNVSSQFTTSKVFQNYLSSNIDAHMLTNLEWGAVAYLSHSIYGLCDGTTSCRDIYHNNSSGYYTGRSAGVLATDSTYSTDGTYDYKGYLVGNSTKDISKVASTTGNITGVYDMSGGGFEYVMGNMVDDSGAFYPSYAGNSWNGSSTLDSKYYNSYSYGEYEGEQPAFNRARLGDATAEVVGSGDESYEDAWQPGSGITGAYSGFVSLVYPWFLRGGFCADTGAGPFFFSDDDGSANSLYSFRSSLS